MPSKRGTRASIQPVASRSRLSVASMQTGVNEVMVVAVLDRPLRNSIVIRVSDLTPLTHPPTK